MALKIGGTTVINDGRGLENISNLKTVNGNVVLGTGDISIPTYTHPANHPASVITQDASNRFVTDALRVNTTGFNNAATGCYALQNNTTGVNNAATGSYALQLNTTGRDNTAVGFEALLSNTFGNNSVAIGDGALRALTTAGFSTAVGSLSLSKATGQSNTALGFNGLNSVTTGANNLGIGTAAGQNLTTGNANICIGAIDTTGQYVPVINLTTQNNHIAMGSSGVTNAYIQVPWTVVSDARDKTNFAAIPHGLDFVKQLKPTAYQFRTSRESEATNGGVRYGFKAQDIAAIEPESVIVDTTNPEKLYYNESNLIPILVKAIQEQQISIEALREEIEALKKELYK